MTAVSEPNATTERSKRERQVALLGLLIQEIRHIRVLIQRAVG